MTLLFLLKQKTAYVQRISAWSSGGCASGRRRCLPWSRPARASALAHERPQIAAIGNRHAADADIDRRRHRHHARKQFDAVARGHVAQHRIAGQRSEEHTSELQSLMRNSYAVFCLKKKNNNNKRLNNNIE